MSVIFYQRLWSLSSPHLNGDSDWGSARQDISTWTTGRAESSQSHFSWPPFWPCKERNLNAENIYNSKPSTLILYNLNSCSWLPWHFLFIWTKMIFATRRICHGWHAFQMDELDSDVIINAREKTDKIFHCLPADG